MKKILFIWLIASLFLLVGCKDIDLSELSDEDLERISEKAVICNKPYIRVGIGCCLDRDDNQICDKDEGTVDEGGVVITHYEIEILQSVAEQKALQFIYEHTKNKEVFDKEVTVENYVTESWMEEGIWHVMLNVGHTPIEVLVYNDGNDNIKVLTKTDYWKSVPSTPEEETEEEIPEEEKTEEELISEEIIRIGLQGGHLETAGGTYRDYDGNKISYLCYNIEGSPICKKRELSITDMEKELLKSIENKFISSKITITILDEKVIVKKDDQDYEFPYPLGELYKVSQDIIDFETTNGEFDQLTYMLGTRGRERIEKLRPYPDKIYKINKQDSTYMFQFAIQGEPL